MTIKEEFKLVKKVLRKHGCLRAYRRMLRKEANLTLFEDVCLLCGGTNGHYLLYYTKKTHLWINVEVDLYKEQAKLDNK